MDPNSTRGKHMQEQSESYGLNYCRVEGISHPETLVSQCLGHSKIIYQHLASNIFEPFLILEDDASIKNFMEEVTVPDNCDAIYLGISGPANNFNYYGCESDFICKTVGSGIKRIWNMCSSHAILITSQRYAIAYLTSMIECAAKKWYYDIFAVRLFPFFNVYALEVPMYIQKASIGGNELATDITLSERKDTDMTKDELKDWYKAVTYTHLLYKNISRTDTPGSQKRL